MASKSQFQALSFLRQYTPKTDLDRDMIIGFLEKRYRITPKTSIFCPTSHENYLDVQSFTRWYESGYSATEIAKNGKFVIILGSCSLDKAQIIGKMTGDLIEPMNQSVPANELSPASDDEIRQFQSALLRSKLQFNPDKMELEAKYIPNVNEKVIFHNHDHSVKGLGVVSDIDEGTDEVELYCYFIYPTKQAEARIGYSMHERNIVNLEDYTFEPLLEDDKRFSADDGVSAYRRLKRELEKESKVWKDKIHRIEPAVMKAEKGKKYWYINDKMNVVQDMEKETQTSHIRYLAGNYFVDYEAALRMLNKFQDMLRGYLASPDWPKMNK